jgi:hypothetical protein
VDQTPLSLQSPELLAAVLAASSDARRVPGDAPGARLGQSVLQLIHPDELDTTLGELASRKREPQPSTDPVVARIAHSAGHWVTVEESGNTPIEHSRASGTVDSIGSSGPEDVVDDLLMLKVIDDDGLRIRYGVDDTSARYARSMTPCFRSSTPTTSSLCRGWASSSCSWFGPHRRSRSTNSPTCSAPRVRVGAAPPTI